MRLLPLFRVQVRHDYYGESACSDLIFEPTSETRRLLARYRLLLEELSDGIAISAAADGSDSKTQVALQRDEAFVFHVFAQNPDFALFTDLQDVVGKTDPVFVNAGTKDRTLELRDRESWRTETFVIPAGTNAIRFTLAGNPLATNGDLHAVPQVADFGIEAPAETARITGYDAAAKTLAIESNGVEKVSVRYRAKPRRDKRYLADVELRHDNSMPKPGEGDLPFELRFKARTGRWAYYLITDREGDFSIVDSSTSRPALAFSEANRTFLNQVTGEDPLAAALSQQYPNLKPLRFLSDQAVPFSRAARKGLELRLDGEKVLEVLPNPSIRHLSQIKHQGKVLPQYQDTLYQVVKHLQVQ